MNQPPESERWPDCPVGELARTVGRVRRRLLRRRLVKSSLAASAVLVFVAAGLWVGMVDWKNDPGAGLVAGISCEDVQQRLPDYVAGRLTGPIADQVREHLAQCPVCQAALAKLTAEVSLRRANSAPQNRLAIAWPDRDGPR